MNICGCLVHVARERAKSAKAAIEAHEGAEVHATDDDGRFVVVVEDTGARRASEIIMDLHQIPGVVSLTLTYHHFEVPRHTYGHQQATGGQTYDHL